MPPAPFSRLALAAALGLPLLLSAAAPAGESPSPGESLRLGMRIYREGILPSGEPVRAVVQGDIPVEGTMFTCEGCHLRSGMGSFEGTVITLPTSGMWLSKPRPTINSLRLLTAKGGGGVKADRYSYFAPQGEIRPAYTDQALAAVLRTGRDPTGRVLSPTMPRYLLDDGDMALLIAYLRGLSAAFSPGVTAETIHLATVVSAGVGEADRSSMVEVLQAMVDAHNRQWRNQKGRDESGPFYRQEKSIGFRTLTLHVWELTGPPAGWRGQLEEHLSRQPVFAMIGGIVEGEWKPVHDFCEERAIPCILPVTDLPVVSDRDWYTLYFSKGHYLEGQAAARYLARAGGLTEGARVVQIASGPGGELAARGFAETWQRSGLPAPAVVRLAEGEVFSDRHWSDALGAGGPVILAAWIGREVLPLLEAAWARGPRPSTLFLSGGLLGDSVYSLPEAMREDTSVTWPFLLPDEGQRRRVAVRGWLRANRIEERSFAVQAKMYFLGWMLPGVLNMTRQLWYRDYLLDVIDMKNDENYAIAVYPALTFGQGQRYGSKSCYIVGVGPGETPSLVKKSDRIIY